MINVCDINVMKPLLAEHGFHFSKAKGQNFLTQKWVPESIAMDAGVDKTAGVLEIGPGIGPLTQQLCLRAEKVYHKALEEAENLEDVYDDKLQYREDFVMDVLYDAAEMALKEDAKMITTELTLNLSYQNEQWWIAADRELLDAIYGGILY